MKSELRVQALEGEMGRMRQQSEALKRRLKDNQEAHDEQGKARARERATLVKEAGDRDRRIRQLESENLRQKSLLKRQGGGDSARAERSTSVTARREVGAAAAAAAAATVAAAREEPVSPPASRKVRPHSAAASPARGTAEHTATASTPLVRPLSGRPRVEGGGTRIPLPPGVASPSPEPHQQRPASSDARHRLERWLRHEVQRVQGGSSAALALAACEDKRKALRVRTLPPPLHLPVSQLSACPTPFVGRLALSLDVFRERVCGLFHATSLITSVLRSGGRAPR